jgi:hypothetical protein
MYELLISELGDKIIKRTNEDGTFSFIPMDEANSDYQRYVNPEAEQFTPSVTNGD